MTKQEKGSKLEQWVVNKLEAAGISARRTRGSGNHTEIGDIYNERFYIECKHRDTTNICFPLQAVKHLKARIPVYDDKTPIFVFENKFGDKFVILDAEDFF